MISPGRGFERPSGTVLVIHGGMDCPTCTECMELLEEAGVKVLFADSLDRARELLSGRSIHLVALAPLADDPGPWLDLLEEVANTRPDCARIACIDDARQELIERVLFRKLAHHIVPPRLSPRICYTLAMDMLTSVGLAHENRRLAEKTHEQLAALEQATARLELQVKERTNELARAQAEWERTFDAIGDPLAIVSPSMRITRCNVALAQHAQLQPKDVFGRLCHRVLADRDQPCPGCPGFDDRGRPMPTHRDVTDPRSGMAFQVYSYPITERGELTSMVCWWRDVTEQRRLFHHLLQHEKMASLGTLAGGVAHEINNPLAAILTWTQLLLSDATPGTELYDGLKEIEANTLRCKEIVRTLKYYARSDGFGERVSLQVNDVVKNVVTVMARGARKKNVILTSELDPALEPVVANLTEMQSIVSNLVSNAIDACASKPGEGHVVVRTMNLPQGRVGIEVEDDGEGMTQDVVARVFEPFFTTKPHGSATGLGLSLALGIAEDYGGTIAVETKPGEGSKFKVILPKYSDSFLLDDDWPNGEEPEPDEE